jgi:hypothetical protein
MYLGTCVFFSCLLGNPLKFFFFYHLIVLTSDLQYNFHGDFLMYLLQLITGTLLKKVNVSRP